MVEVAPVTSITPAVECPTSSQAQLLVLLEEKKQKCTFHLMGF